MSDPLDRRAVVETEPKPEDIRLLDERLYEFNVAATGIADGKLLALFLRDESGAAVGGISGWTWGETCYVRHLFVPADMRNQGHGSRLMRAVEAEAKARGCVQIVLETHDFQAPGFYRRLGFAIAGRVEGYPRGHQYLTMVKRLPASMNVRAARREGYDAEFMRASWRSLQIDPAAIAGGRVFVAVDAADRPLGVTTCALLGEDVDLMHLFVEPGAFGRGVGRALFAAALAWTRAQGRCRLLIASDPNAVGFYRRQGAVDAGTIPSEAVPGRDLPLLTYALDAPAS